MKLFHNSKLGLDRCTRLNILIYVNNTINSLDSNTIAITMFLDIQYIYMAFDTVNHRILVDKLYAYGNRGQYA